MAVRIGRCTNFGNCTIADSGKPVDIPDGSDFVCPECKRQLTRVEEKRSQSPAPILVVLLALLLIGGSAWYWFSHRQAGTAGTPGTTGSATVPPTATVAGEVLFRMHGSNTIGAQLGPALAQAFLKQQGARDVSVVPGAADEVNVRGTISGAAQVIEIQAHGSATAFTDLASGQCDIGMASRAIKPDEVAKLSSFGDMTSPAGEHVLGLDGIAVIVNRANPVTALTTAQAAGIFSGEIPDWSAMGGSGPIQLYARDDKSGTYDTFKTLVLGSRQLAGSAKRVEDSRELSDKVASDPSAIGFVGLPYIGSTKALAISEKGTRPLLPNRLTVATEDYPLSRRLYLYTPPNSKNAWVRKFVEFAMSKQGQDVVGENGFVAQNVNTESVQAPPGSPAEYAKLTSGAQRLSLNFRFRTGSSQLDNKALADLDRVVSFISDLHYSGDDVLLFGFADSTGSDAINDKLSKDRARAVANEFEQRGLRSGLVTGFGSHNPVASNDTDEGREKNRRVEIWVKKGRG